MREGWEKFKLGELCVVERGSSPRPIKKFVTDSEDGVNWVKIGDVSETDKYVWTTKEKITKEGALKSRFVDVGDFILSNSMSFGRPYIMKVPGYIHDGWFVLRLPKTVDPEFFWYLLVSPLLNEQFNSLAAGAIVKNISGDLVKKAELPIPPLSEQKQIVALLDKAFEAIDKAKANIEQNIINAKELFQSKLNEIFSQKGDGWEEKKLKEVCKTGAGGTPLKSKKGYYEGGDIPWIRSGEVNNRNITDSEIKITQEGLDNSSAKLFPPRTVVIAMYGATAGQVGVLNFECSTNQAVCGIYPNQDFIPEFLYYKFLDFKESLISQAVGGAQPNVSQAKIKETLIPCLGIEEQKTVVSLLDNVQEKVVSTVANYSQKLSNLEELKKSILQKAFTGELTAKELTL